MLAAPYSFIDMVLIHGWKTFEMDMIRVWVRVWPENTEMRGTQVRSRGEMMWVVKENAI